MNNIIFARKQGSGLATNQPGSVGIIEKYGTAARIDQIARFIEFHRLDTINAAFQI